MIAGAFKLVDPSGTVGAARALGVTVDDTGVRVPAGAELVLGSFALVWSTEVVAILVALSYVLFGVVTLVALVRGTPIDSCGCLGRLETPPGIRHLVVIGVALFGAVGQAVEMTPTLVERLTDDGGAGVLFTLGTLLLTGAAILAFRAGRQPSTPR